MKNEINAVLENMTTTIPEPEDYTGEDGAFYTAGSATSPKRGYFPKETAAWWGVTATRQNVTASGQSVRNGKPQRNSAVTLKLSSG